MRDSTRKWCKVIMIQFFVLLVVWSSINAQAILRKRWMRKMYEEKETQTRRVSIREYID